MLSVFVVIVASSCLASDLAATAPPSGQAPGNQAAPLQRVVAAEAKLANAPATGRPAALIELGRARSDLVRWTHCPLKSPGCTVEALRERRQVLRKYALAHPDAFSYFEWADVYDYTGSDYRQVLTESGQNEYAEEAAYELSSIIAPYDCEVGETAAGCWLEPNYAPLDGYLKIFGHSLRAVEVVRRANEAFVNAGEQITEDRSEGRIQDITRVVSLIDTYAATARALPPPLAASAWDTLGDVAQRLGDVPRAKRLSARAAALAKEAPEPAARSRARLAHLK